MKLRSSIAFFEFHAASQKCYNKVIIKPELLRKYPNFRSMPSLAFIPLHQIWRGCSPQTYGESTILLVSKLISVLSFTNFILCINISWFVLHRWMRFKWKNVCWPWQRRWTGIVAIWLLHGPLTGLAWSLDFDTLQVCMMVAALSTASRFVFCLVCFEFMCSQPQNISCFGIEIMHNPASYAGELLSQ